MTVTIYRRSYIPNNWTLNGYVTFGSEIVNESGLKRNEGIYTAKMLEWIQILVRKVSIKMVGHSNVYVSAL